MAASFEIAEFWCAECAENALFELVPGVDPVSEYACVSCGAAYVDVLVGQCELPASPRVVA